MSTFSNPEQEELIIQTEHTNKTGHNQNQEISGKKPGSPDHFQNEMHIFKSLIGIYLPTSPTKQAGTQDKLLLQL